VSDMTDHTAPRFAFFLQAMCTFWLFVWLHGYY